VQQSYPAAASAGGHVIQYQPIPPQVSIFTLLGVRKCCSEQDLKDVLYYILIYETQLSKYPFHFIATER